MICFSQRDKDAVSYRLVAEDVMVHVVYRGGTSYEKLGGRKISGVKRPPPNFFLQLLPLFRFAPIYGGHMPFCRPVKAMHAVTIMSLKAKSPLLCVRAVLTSRQIR